MNAGMFGLSLGGRSLLTRALPRALQRLQYRDGQEWFVVSAKWWTMWKEYASFAELSEDGSAQTQRQTSGEASKPPKSADRKGSSGGDEDSEIDGAVPSPGRISTEGLVREGRRAEELKPKLTEGYDYHVILRKHSPPWPPLTPRGVWGGQRSRGVSWHA